MLGARSWTPPCVDANVGAPGIRDKTTKRAGRRWPTLAARMRPLARRLRRPARFLEGNRRVCPPRRSDRAPLGTGGGPARAPPPASRARQRLRVQIRDRRLAAVRPAAPRLAASGRGPPYRPRAGTTEIDRGAALHEPEQGSGERV